NGLNRPLHVVRHCASGRPSTILARRFSVRARREGRPVRCRDVFVLEDEALIAMEIETMLRSAGYRVIGPASSITEAMQICDALTDGCALLDVNLDGAAVTPVACLLAERG